MGKSSPNFFIALTIFVALNKMLLSFEQKYDDVSVAAHLQQPLVADLSSALLSCYYLSKAKSTLTDFQSLPASPRIVLLGSSLMLYPFWDADRAIGIRTGDVGYYHRSLFLEDKLREDGYKIRVFNWSTLLQMVSDSYLICKEFLALPATQLIVLGVAPRDFYDNLLPVPGETYYYRAFASSKELFDDAYFGSALKILDYLLNKCCPFYADRSSMQSWFSGQAYAATMKLFHLKQGLFYMPPFYLPRYKNISVDKMQKQEEFFTKLIKQAKLRHQKLIVVNMPLSKSNRDMLPPFFYDKYRSTIEQLCKDNWVPFLDMAVASEPLTVSHAAHDCETIIDSVDHRIAAGSGKSENVFCDSDYYDGVHLNRFGAARFVRLLLPYIESQLPAAK